MSNDSKFPICHCCGKPIEDVAFIEIIPTIILQKYFTQTPPIFKCKEQIENYTQRMRFHDDCWMKELENHGVELHNMTEVLKKYAQKTLDEISKIKEGG